MIPRWTLPAFLAVGLVAARADADVTKDQCVDANANAQRLRLAGKLSASRKELITCADAGCPALVRDDCARRLDELAGALPTIIFDVKDARGSDVPDATVTVDGLAAGARLDGTAIPVDPGLHSFRFEVPGHAPIDRTFVIKEAERGRRERVVVEDVAASPARSSQRTLGLVAGGAGVAGIAVGSVFGLLASAAWSDQKSACGSPSTCTPAGHTAALADHSTLTTDGAVSTVAFAAGGALVATGALLFFLAPSPAPRVTVAPSVGVRGATLDLRGSF